MTAAILREAAADLRVKAKRADDLARDPAYGEVTGGPDAHWSSAFLEGAILGHPHVIDDDPQVREVVAVGAALLAAFADPAVALAVVDSIEEVLVWFDPEDCTEAERGMHDALLAVARAYLGGVR